MFLNDIRPPGPVQKSSNVLEVRRSNLKRADNPSNRQVTHIKTLPGHLTLPQNDPELDQLSWGVPLKTWNLDTGEDQRRMTS